MKKLLLSSALVVALGLSFNSCRETEKKTDAPAVVIEKKTDNVPNKKEGTLEKAGRAIDNAAKEVKEAGKAVGSAAKQVGGDDN